MEELQKKKEELLLAQRDKADKFHAILSGPGGLNETSRKTSISASKKPGYFSYFDQPEVVKAIIKNGELRKLQTAILQLQQKIEQVDVEIANYTKAANVPGAAGTTSDIQTFKQWFTTYGTPKPVTSGVLTSFSANPKVYGGTEHYSAFKTQSTTMKKGRLTK
ncbi:hypothetical protein AC1031_006293 [Aphanomyces cochlioides]|nr:hypothetical protein AC1031_006293 [Aphanomyces cochlioides]